MVDQSEIRAIAKDAYIYGFPLVDNYRVQYSYFEDRANPEFKAPWNTLKSIARVYTPKDRVIQAPNSDTPFSFAGADLRAEPLVITVPAIEQDRYYSIQLIDMYTHTFDYIGTRTTGNDAGSYLLAGPGWLGAVPPDIKKVFRSETEFAFIQHRTQLVNPADIENVKRIQAGYKVQPLSAFLGRPAPPAAPRITFPKPLSPAAQKTSLEFFRLLEFVLQSCPVHPSETAIRARIARLGVGESFEASKLSLGTREAISAGMRDAWATFDDLKKAQVDTGKLTTGDVFGTREHLKNDYLKRMIGAVLGIYGHAKDEAIYPVYFVDSEGQPLDGANRYTLRFAPGQLPPVNAFWSITLYELPAILLVENPIDRYLINSAMLADLKRDADGGVTILVQHESPGKDKEANWLPAPSGSFDVTLRLYLPKPSALDGTWKQPPLERVK